MSNENNENNIENSNFYIESEENKYNTNQDNENIINKKDNDNEKTKKLEIEIPKNFQNSKEREFYEACNSACLYCDGSSNSNCLSDTSKCTVNTYNI